ncbi:MAG: protein kinase [Anaerolineales bacterium]|nr:protein kinase [Anaerolineales bacterium]
MAGFLKRFSKSIQTHIPDPKSGAGVGAVINQRYQLDEEIGRGGMGIVYRAQDLQVQRVVALKIINLNTANDLSLGQFKREMDILSKLDHPHIVSFFDAGFEQ